MDTAVRFPTSPAALKAAPVKLSRRMRVEQAFQAVARSCLDQIEGNEAGVARYHDAESLHQMRIGLRRLDAAFKLFRDLLQAPPAIVAELAWLLEQLGPARDWDVFVDSTLPRVTCAMPGHGELDPLRVVALERSGALFAQASAAVASIRFSKLVNALEQWSEQRGWRDDLTARGIEQLHVRVGDFADTVLAQAQQRLLRRGNKLKQADARRRHRVRIAAKRTRYATEFFAALYPGKRVRPYVQALTGLQDELGWLNDAAVATRLLDQASEVDPGVRQGAALVRGYLAACCEQGERTVPKLWKKFKPVARPR
ncbi:MAG: CHAD domain-containing protein [Pseudomonadota bacterium]